MHAPPPPESQATLQRYALSILGLGLVGIVVYVSASLNWSFGYSLGRTPEDAKLYGLASVAADGLKCLSPFFFFAAWRTRSWSQAAAAATVWAVTTVYALAGAFGHAALNRTDSASMRQVASGEYTALLSDRARIQKAVADIPHYRPTGTVEAEIEAKKTERMFRLTGGCGTTNSPAARTWCIDLRKLEAERASAAEGSRLSAELAGISARLAPYSKAGAATQADPQVAFLSKLTGQDAMFVTTALLLLIVALLEVCSGLAPYAVLSYFPDRPTKRRKEEVKAPAAANDTAPANVVPFPSPKQETAALEAAPAMDGSNVEAETFDAHVFKAEAPPLANASDAEWPPFAFSLPAPKSLAEQDLHERLAAGASIPKQRFLAERWGIAESTCSDWLKSWDWVSRRREGRVSVVEASHRVAA